MVFLRSLDPVRLVTTDCRASEVAHAPEGEPECLEERLSSEQRDLV